MAGSSFGNKITITTWGESHGAALGVVIDGFPAGLSLCEEDIQIYLDRRKPGQSKYTTQRAEGDKVEILSGVFEGHTTGTPISLMVRNNDQHSKDYDALKEIYRPGHADYTFDKKYGIRDHRGGGRSSGRETIGRVAAGAVAASALALIVAAGGKHGHGCNEHQYFLHSLQLLYFNVTIPNGVTMVLHTDEAFVVGAAALLEEFEGYGPVLL